MSDDIESCAQIVRSGDPDRFLSAMTAGGADRDALMVLYAFNVEVSRAPWVTQEPLIAQMRLQWWLDVIEQIYEGQPVRRHEVVTPLAALIARCDLPRAAFERMINAREWDVFKEPFEDEAALDTYLRNTGGALMGLSLAALGGDFARGEDYGAAVSVAALLQAVPALEAAGRYPLVDGTHQGVAALAAQALTRAQAARRALVKTQRSARAALRAGWMARGILRQAAAAPHLVAQGDLGGADAGKKLRLMGLALIGGY